jgi:hypothetical protein
MKAKLLLLLFAALLLILGSVTSYTEDAQNIQTRVIEGFEKPGTWVVKFSKFRAPHFKKIDAGYTNPEAQKDRGKPAPSQSWISWFTASDKDLSFLPDGLPPEVRGKTQKTIMGVRATFTIPGYNWIVVEPKEPLNLYGVVKSLDCWIWGGGYKYDVQFVVKDYKGFYHVLNAGTINHYGWKNFRVKVPGWVPQSSRWLPKTKPLEFIRFKVIGRPTAREDGLHVYFDYMQVQTDIYVERFNGDDLVKLNWQKRGVRGTGKKYGDGQQSGQQGNQQGQPGGQGQPPAGNQ